MCGKPRLIQSSDVGSWMPATQGSVWSSSNPRSFTLLFSLYSLQANYQLHGLRPTAWPRIPTGMAARPLAPPPLSRPCLAPFPNRLTA
jgi:hypothetical protein